MTQLILFSTYFDSSNSQEEGNCQALQNVVDIFMDRQVCNGLNFSFGLINKINEIFNSFYLIFF